MGRAGLPAAGGGARLVRADGAHVCALAAKPSPRGARGRGVQRHRWRDCRGAARAAGARPPAHCRRAADRGPVDARVVVRCGGGQQRRPPRQRRQRCCCHRLCVRLGAAGRAAAVGQRFDREPRCGAAELPGTQLAARAHRSQPQRHGRCGAPGELPGALVATQHRGRGVGAGAAERRRGARVWVVVVGRADRAAAVSALPPRHVVAACAARAAALPRRDGLRRQPCAAGERAAGDCDVRGGREGEAGTARGRKGAPRRGAARDALMPGVTEGRGVVGRAEGW
eukprot:39602-Chlamydomonas_euryale.AAC.1